ncbi:SagB/ThcOx family dehydrogenase [Anaerolinea sp.]|uniref:SagB/ThcOx family dehydrogenase n=1 Tax=Anaerolinea sp. TaxID=1872519 RepID=UPI002ACD58CF|nr:SagB/ThcOx family dehydrogenase [Anaerolinea sp.]
MRQFFEEFLKKTAYESLSRSPQEQGIPQPPLELPYPEGATLIPLPAPDTWNIPSADLRKTIEQRRSRRHYEPVPLTLEQLAYLLWLTQGVQKKSSKGVTLRTVPSAGARHAFETFLLINRVEGLEPGLYRYIATRHALLRLDAPEDIRERMTIACWNQEQVRQSAVTFLWVAATERMAWRYVERSMRYLHLDAGHVCQNLYLAAESIGFGVCAIAAFHDQKVNNLLHLDGVDQFVIYIGSVGKPTISR